MARIATIVLALLAATQAQAQEVVARFTCDLNGAPGTMTMGIHYQNAYGISADRMGHVSGVFPVGVTVYIGGELRSQSAYYTFRGENQYADFTDRSTGQSFRVEWVLDAPGNGVWMKINPFGDTTVHFCAFRGVG